MEFGQPTSNEEYSNGEFVYQNLNPKEKCECCEMPCKKNLTYNWLCLFPDLPQMSKNGIGFSQSF